MLDQNGEVLCQQLNGVSANIGEYFGRKSPIMHEQSVRDEEMLRLIGQYLCDKGLNAAYAQLSKESGISLEHVDATELRHATLEGRWNDAEAALGRLAPMIGDSDSVEEVRFLLLEQRFLEHLEANEVMPAVTLLRNRITPMQRNTERVHTLASCLMCRTDAELRAQAGGWAGKDAGSRLQLINRIQAFVPAQTMLPPRRLEELIDDSVRAQLNSCIFHNPPLGAALDLNSISLLQRHSCGMQDFPAFCIQTLDQRDSELWFCQFSPDGCYLAAGGKEANVDVWRVDTVRHTVSFFRVLTTPAYVACLCWSPDSKKLAACCGEDQSCVCVFDVFSGQQLCNQKVNDEDTYSTASFFADSRKLAFGGLKGIFYVMDTEDHGRILTSVEGYRVQSMAAILPPLPQIALDSAAEPGKVSSTDMSAPGGPDSSLNECRTNGMSVEQSSGTSASQVDQLLVVDTLYRLRLFRFGYLGSATSAATTNLSDGTAAEAGDAPTPMTTATESPGPTNPLLTVPSISRSSGLVASSVEGTSIPPVSVISRDPSALATSGAAPGAPGTTSVDTSSTTTTSASTVSTTTLNVDNPSVAAALTVARLSRQQQRLLQSSLNTSSGSTGHLSWYQLPYQQHSLSSAHTLSAQTGANTSYSSGGSALPPSILLDMPILPVSLTRLGGSSQAQGVQTHPQNLRPVLQHSGSTTGGTPYTVVSSSSGSNYGSGGGSSLTILFGAPLERSTSTTCAGSTTTSTEVRALTAAAAAAALAGSHSRSFAGLVHSLSTMVAAGSSSIDASSGAIGRALTGTSEAMIGPTVTTTSTSTSTMGPLSIGGNLASVSTTASSATSTTGFTPPTVLGQPGTGTNYGLLDHRTLFKETHPVQSITMSRSGQRALITIHKMGLHLWDVEACAIVQRFVGYKQETFRIQSTFGGANEDFVATGSENGRIHIWHVNSGSHPIHSASSSTGNRDAVTCVHWNPVLPTMIASVNDAGELCIWGPQRYLLGSGQPMDAS
ncbi:unnamed protein product [Calicophoron daubneyi]|uniref:CTLH domain-containing protein n=1 Tax=Calicophoron daubneyi TaxID=300641 RepID=A0AAV2TKG8_CALDB